MARIFTITEYGQLRQATRRAVILNNQILFTRGMRAISWGALFAPLAPITGTITLTCDENGSHAQLFAQAQHDEGQHLARLLFLAPGNALDSRNLPELIEGLVQQVSLQGAHGLAAEANEDHSVVQALRHNGFSIYARQRNWKLTQAVEAAEETGWRPMLERDQFPVEQLYKALVPGQVQQTEVPSSEPMDGYVYSQDGEVVAFAEVKRGPRGVWARPFVHLDAEPFGEAMAGLIAQLRPRAGRPVYVCLRSNQEWLHHALEDLGAKPGPRQVAMVRRTTLPLPVEETRRLAVPNRGAEPSTPIHIPNPQPRFELDWTTYDPTRNN